MRKTLACFWITRDATGSFAAAIAAQTIDGRPRDVSAGFAVVLRPPSPDFRQYKNIWQFSESMGICGATVDRSFGEIIFREIWVE